MYHFNNHKYLVNSPIFFDPAWLEIKFFYPMAFKFVIIGCSFFVGHLIHAQNIPEIITDYQGYWKSSTSVINPVKPNNNHNLLAFSFNGNRYSTGVNDAILTTQGDNFIAGDYKALPVQSINGTINSNTKIGVGAMFDAVAIGPGNPPPNNNIPYYLTDGQKGLNIGTCVANLPSGTLFFSVGHITSSAIGDEIPDVVITQTADPSSSSFDRYEFTDINGNRIGNYRDIVLSTISPVGRWVADFYEASTNPMQLMSTFTNTERPLRLWAADFSSFGIQSTDISSIAYFKITLSGTSDVAFVAYNNTAITFSSVLPAKLSSFTAIATGDQINLTWKTLSEYNTDHYTIEISTDGVNFSALTDIKAAGNNSNPFNYYYIHQYRLASKLYYRLKQIDADNKYWYSKIISVDGRENKVVSVYPNPAINKLVIHYNDVSGSEQFQLVTSQGRLIMQSKLHPGKTEINLPSLHLYKGLYFLVILDEKEKISYPLLIQ